MLVDQENKRLDPEKVLPLSLIRKHTRTEDVEAIDDILLSFYRDAALEAAEEYLGMPIISQRWINEEVQQPKHKQFEFHYIGSRTHFAHKVQFPFAKNRAYFYGAGQAAEIQVKVGDTKVMLPRSMNILSSGATACGTNATEPANVGYYTGYSCESEIPKAIAMGSLKYIAHVLENAGDLVVAVSDSGSATTGDRVDQASNPALASGAIEIWRTARPDAI